MITEIKTFLVECCECEKSIIVQAKSRIAALDSIPTTWESASDREIWCSACVEKYENNDQTQKGIKNA